MAHASTVPHYSFGVPPRGTAQEERTTMTTETLKSAEELVHTYLDADIAVWMEGPPGVGKSDLWRQIAKKRGVGFIDIRLGQLDPVDLRGLPTVERTKEDIYTIWSKADMWPQLERDGPKGLILLDELADTSRSMQSAAYQVILDRQIGAYKLLDGWIPVAASNRREDKAAAQMISTALASRFAWIEIAADASCFREYGDANGYHHYVTGFIGLRGELLHKMDGSNGKAFPCPRQWERVSRICKQINIEHLPKGGVTENRTHRLVRGLVGDGPASEFCAFIRGLNLPDLEEIIRDPKRTHIPEEPSNRYALTGLLSRSLSRENIGKIMLYTKRPEFGADFEACVVFAATKRDGMLCDTEAYIDFADRRQGLQL